MRSIFEKPSDVQCLPAPPKGYVWAFCMKCGSRYLVNEAASEEELKQAGAIYCSSHTFAPVGFGGK